ncbi:radical SAM family heme chaperone HemW [Lutispora thermophila]|uniref:Heme chaperone HemW n=1 Tax=Lutispora thermophila DSM 19022 TaxID=1122184 RepID=A0A1M6DCR7_9FIRM|nr:radical SAM family heme chaperone HemW [Lutispora thermophila]SHI70798.1 oxygen-independent coproporphyrinogen-3 oxidase [Lutispora thermophila DSM 19022]
MKNVGLYIHIPFCMRKCLYCDFNSYSNKDIYENYYIEALIKELKYYLDAQEYRFRTIFIGGGTPTIINPENIAKIMETIEKNIEKDAEITIECNPGTIDKNKIDIYKTIGINRISIGLQAWQDDLLKAIGRIHKRDDFLNSFKLFREHGFNNINVDLMFSLPGQNIDMWLETLENVCVLGVEHISCYSLIVEEGTPIHRLIQSGELRTPDEDMDREMYRLAKNTLEAHGLRQYEISNFAKEGFCCAHNLIYWRNEEYIGVGAGSHSKIDNRRFWNYEDLNVYINCLQKGILPIKDSEIIGFEEELWETIILGLRLNSGLNISEINKKYNINFLKRYEDTIKKLEGDLLIVKEGNSINLTDKGRDLSNRVFIEFM